MFWILGGIAAALWLLIFLITRPTAAEKTFSASREKATKRSHRHLSPTRMDGSSAYRPAPPATPVSGGMDMTQVVGTAFLLNQLTPSVPETTVDHHSHPTPDYSTPDVSPPIDYGGGSSGGGDYGASGDF